MSTTTSVLDDQNRPLVSVEYTTRVVP